MSWNIDYRDKSRLNHLNQVQPSITPFTQFTPFMQLRKYATVIIEE